MNLVKNETAQNALALMPLINDSLTISYTRKAILEFDSVCSYYQKKAIYAIIPSIASNDDIMIMDSSKVFHVFKDLPYYFPANLSRKLDFPSNDSHFNNNGSEKFAEFLDSLIQNATLNK